MMIFFTASIQFLKSIRRCQFVIGQLNSAPFAALTGHKEAVQETQRLVEQKRILDEHQKLMLNEKLQEITLRIKETPNIRVTYFQADERKDGGRYLTLIMRVKRIDEYQKRLVFTDRSWIRLEDLYEIELLSDS